MIHRRPKRSFLLLLVVGWGSAIAACTPTLDRPTTNAGDTVSAPPERSQPSLQVEGFTLDELFAQGSGGCGMTLWHQADGQQPTEFLFFNGLPDAAGHQGALMKLDGEFVRLRRTAAAGEEFYGQQRSQTFASPDNALQVQVETTLGEPGEIESVAVEGTLQLQHNGTTLDLPVQGDAGC
ncbi:hypothetical protein [Nodosilinea sp. E11]|uniref:hypothetical protein n=1 Tax=Nodosilinea sp. E11 TaxID=3037479 RepID=UPI002934A4F1|nr:hypothetical protein [Nodosilinea sp. E11]